MIQLNNWKVYGTDKSQQIVEVPSFTAMAGNITGIHGTSGSGKSTILRALLEDSDLYSTGSKYIDTNEGSIREISTYIPQDISSSISSYVKLKNLLHFFSIDDLDKFKSTLLRFGIKNIDRLMDSYQLENSGGQLQRFLIALSLASNKKIIVADEPFSSLDLVNTRRVFESIREYVTVNNACCILVTHDKSILSLCDSIYFMQEGFLNPENYFVENEETSSAPSTRKKLSDKIILQAKNLHYSYGPLKVLSGVNLTIKSNEFIAIQSESGCGKSTLANLLSGLLEIQKGKIEYEGKRPILIPQNPLSSFNPIYTLKQSILEVIIHFNSSSTPQELFDQVGLSPTLLNRYPREVSGGEIQRAAIARALAAEPDIILADEPTSSLDHARKVEIIKLFCDISAVYDTCIIVFTHDMAFKKFVDWSKDLSEFTTD